MKTPSSQRSIERTIRLLLLARIALAYQMGLQLVIQKAMDLQPVTYGILTKQEVGKNQGFQIKSLICMNTHNFTPLGLR